MAVVVVVELVQKRVRNKCQLYRSEEEASGQRCPSVWSWRGAIKLRRHILKRFAHSPSLLSRGSR
ncbi:hypothetical protein E2C01_079293 [Portunus trituberculatus]|uniref:Uncharacterized protein n=1 Tax=Portunus trituberculatus TaxID=210409 RepID=A0A5B7IQ85_PORTR|nr:hypothetical protein [Portunus trituberculatus]